MRQRILYGAILAGSVALTHGALGSDAGARAQTAMRPTQTQTVQARSVSLPPGLVAVPPSALHEAPAPRRMARPTALAAPPAELPVTLATAQEEPSPFALGKNCTTNSANGFAPSDVVGAVGPTSLVVVSNALIAVYDKSTCTVVASHTLSGLFAGAMGETLFNPQVLWDNFNQRFIVTAESTFRNNADQNQYFAVSKDSAGTDYFTYKVAIISGASLFCVAGTAPFWDYPHVGSVNGANSRWMITANVLSSGAATTSSLLTIDKGPTLAGNAVLTHCFGPFQFNLAPANVIDSSSTAFLLSPGAEAGNTVQRYTLNFDDTITTLPAIQIPAWTVAPPAKQPNGIPLDALDGRFVAATIQNGTNLWNVHNIAVGSVGLIRAYRFDTSATSALNIATLSTTNLRNPSDNLFNASLAVNQTQVFISASRTISSVPTTGNAAMLIITGSSSFGGGFLAETVAISASQYDGTDCDLAGAGFCRWGNTSSTQIDPSNSKNAWAFNQLITGPSQLNWTTRAAAEVGPLSPATHDFNGDAKSDIAWRDNTGNTAAWLMNGASLLQAGGFGQIPTAWTLVGQRDFDHDGKSDWLWRDSSGNTAIWFMNGLAVTSTASLGNVPPVWTVVGTGDFDGGGVGDILWRDSQGNLALWLMNGAQVVQSFSLGNVPTVWSIVGVADFNGDGRADLLWRDNAGNVAIWLMDGGSVLQAAGLGNVSTVWSVVGTGDFTGNGIADILWQDNSGNVAVWLMNGVTVVQAAVLGNVGSVWSVAETGDFNSDGMSDILWRDASGNVAIWFMNGTSIALTASLGNVQTVWTIQGLNAD